MVDEIHYDASNGLDVVVKRNFLSSQEEREMFELLKNIPWYRVCYESER